MQRSSVPACSWGIFPFSFVFSKWNACSSGFRSGDWLGHCIIFHFFALKNSLVAFAVCLRVIVHLHCEVPSNEFWSIWLNMSRKYWPKHLGIHPAFVSSHIINKYKGNQFHWQPYMPTPWHYHHHHHHASLMRWYVLDHEQFLFFSSHHSGTRWSLSHLSIGCCSRTVKAFFRCCLANSNLVFSVFEAHQWFTSCGEPSVFTLVKSSLDCWLWHTYTYLLESVLDLANCCEGFFLHLGNNSSVIHHSCFPWSSGSFGVAELTGAFFLFKNVPNSWFGPRLMFLLSLWSVCFDFSAQWWLASLIVTALWISYWELTATDSKCK